jgi:transcription-repair coupling factor (superfamily II helicase)
MWNDLIDKIEGLAAYRELLKKLEAEGAHVPAAGLYGSARSLVVAALASERKTPCLVVAPDPVRARDVEEDLGIFGVDGVVPYPEDEMLPYDYHDPDRSLTGLQMKALDALGEGRCRVLVCTIRSALKKVFPRKLFRSLLVDVRAGEERDPRELAERLVHLGYERHETVEAKGQFAVRGMILDIFEVSEEAPVRMEFDGDTIVSMRDFDIETQRSTASRESLRVYPPHHISLTDDGVARLAERIRRETAGASDEERAKLMLPAERLEKGISFFGMEHYAAAVHGVVPLFAHFDVRPVVVLVDAEDVESALGDFREEISRSRAASRSTSSNGKGPCVSEPPRRGIIAGISGPSWPTRGKSSSGETRSISSARTDSRESGPRSSSRISRWRSTFPSADSRAVSAGPRSAFSS